MKGVRTASLYRAAGPPTGLTSSAGSGREPPRARPGRGHRRVPRAWRARVPGVPRRCGGVRHVHPALRRSVRHPRERHQAAPAARSGRDHRDRRLRCPRPRSALGAGVPAAPLPSRHPVPARSDTGPGGWGDHGLRRTGDRARARSSHPPDSRRESPPVSDPRAETGLVPGAGDRVASGSPARVRRFPHRRGRSPRALDPVADEVRELGHRQGAAQGSRGAGPGRPALPAGRVPGGARRPVGLDLRRLGDAGSDALPILGSGGAGDLALLRLHAALRACERPAGVPVPEFRLAAAGDGRTAPDADRVGWG